MAPGNPGADDARNTTNIAGTKIRAGYGPQFYPLKQHYPPQDVLINKEPPNFPQVDAPLSTKVNDPSHSRSFNMNETLALPGVGPNADFNTSTRYYTLAVVSRETFDKGLEKNKVDVQQQEAFPSFTLGNGNDRYLIMPHRVAEAVCRNMRLMNGKDGVFRLYADTQGVPACGIFRGHTTDQEPLTNIVDATAIKAYQGNDPVANDFVPADGFYQLTLVDNSAAQKAFGNVNIQVKDWNVFPQIDVKGRTCVALPNRMVEAMRSRSPIVGQLQLRANKDGTLRAPFMSNLSVAIAQTDGAKSSQELMLGDHVSKMSTPGIIVVVLIILIIVLFIARKVMG